jgi:hypothetical protein
VIGTSVREMRTLATGSGSESLPGSTYSGGHDALLVVASINQTMLSDPEALPRRAYPRQHRVEH